MQRALNEDRAEPLQAIVPGVALKQLWDLIGIAGRAMCSRSWWLKRACWRRPACWPAWGLTHALLAVGQPLLAARYGIFVPLTGLDATDITLLTGIVAAALVMGLWPAWRAYRNTLADGLTIRI